MKFDLTYQKLQLKNGACVFYVTIPYAQTATVMAIVEAGPRFDPVNKTGLSHLIEHIKLRNTETAGDGTSLPAQIEEVGSSPRGFTYFETTKYWINLLPEYSTQGTEFLCRILNTSQYGDIVVEKEKKTVSEELRIIESNPGKKIWEVWTSHIFRGTELGNGYIGNASTLKLIDKNDVSKFSENWYTPQRMNFIIAGNLSSATKRKNTLLIDASMVRRESGGETRRATSRELLQEDPVFIEKESNKTLNVIVGFRTVAVAEHDHSVFTLIKFYLNGGLHSKFGQTLVLGGLVYFVNSFAYHLSETGYFCTLFTALPNNIDPILKIIYTEIRELCKGNIDKDRLESAKRYAIFQQRSQLNSPLDVANFYAQQCPYSNENLHSPGEEDAEILRVTELEVFQAAKKYFTKKSLRIAVVGNIEKQAVSVDL